MLVGLPSPALLGSLAGGGDMLPGVPCGEFGDGVVSVVPLGVPDVSDGVDTVEPLPVELLEEGDEGDDVVSPVVVGVDAGPDIDELPVVDVVDGLDIELSVVGCSDLLQAPSAATVAMIATHWIERCMCAPRYWGGTSVRRAP